MEKDIELLTRAAANHLILGQFEPLRAALLSLRARRPELALAFLRRIVFSGGRVPSALPSPSAPSPAHLAWLAALELLQFPSAASDAAALRLKTEFLLLLQLISDVSSAVPGDSSVSGEISRILNRLSDLGLQRLRDDLADVTEVCTAVQAVTEEEMKCLRGSVLEHPEMFDALCANIERQVRLSEPEAPELAIVVVGEAREGEDAGVEGLEAPVPVQRNVQLAHLDALKVG